MEQKLAVQSQGTFLDTAIMDLAQMQVAAKMILDSKLAPDHFYEKGADNKPDYTKGKVESVILVCVHGHDLGLKPLVALQHIIPVNGLLSIKGDAAKTLIFKSGKLEPGSWKETVSGNISDDSYECTITAKRRDTQETMSRTFGVSHAKRAGLWIDEKKIRGDQGWKYQKSAWYKYPERMIAYRALGFLARDLFPDVLSGSYTTEEAIDLPQDETVVIETNTGAQAQIPDSNFSQERSKALTSKATEQIDKRNHVEDIPEEVKKQPMTPDESYATVEVMLNGTPGHIIVYSEDDLKTWSVEDLNDLIDKDSLMQTARERVPGKNTNKKLRQIILSKYNGDLVSLIASHDQEFQDPFAGKVPDPPDPEVEQVDADPIADQRMDAADMEQATYEAGVEAEVDPEDPSTWPEGNADPDVSPNTAFDVTAPDEEPKVEGNKFEIEIPELVDGKRGFDQVKSLFEELANKAGVDNNAYESLVKSKFPEFQKYRTKEDFCYTAEVSEINTLLNSI
jgi:hypothetical protein